MKVWEANNFYSSEFFDEIDWDFVHSVYSENNDRILFQI